MTRICDIDAELFRNEEASKRAQVKLAEASRRVTRQVGFVDFVELADPAAMAANEAVLKDLEAERETLLKRRAYVVSGLPDPHPKARPERRFSNGRRVPEPGQIITKVCE